MSAAQESLSLTVSNVMQEFFSKSFEEAILPVMERLLNESMVMEREKALGAEAYERSENRRGHANGFKPKNFTTRHGTLQLKIPQTRGVEFYPNCLEKGIRSEKALKLALAEAYVQGVSTRKVSQISELLCGKEVSSQQVSRLAQVLDEELKAFNERPLGRFKYLYLDARYEKVRMGGIVSDAAVLQAVGINEEGKPEYLGVSVSLSEGEVHWRTFLSSLLKRGLCGVVLIISDDHAGLKEARKKVFGSTPWQRCFFHLQQNAQSYVLSKDNKSKAAHWMREIFSAYSKEEALKRMNAIVSQHEKSEPKLCQWMTENAEESMTYFSFPQEHWRKIRTSNILENLNRQIKRRTRVASIFPNEASCLRLVGAVVMEKNEDWITGRQYIVWEKGGVNKEGE